MRRAHDKSSSSGWQEDQVGQTGQQTGATGTGPGTASGAGATGGRDTGQTSGGTQAQYGTTTRTYEGSAQPASGYGRTEQRGGYAQAQQRDDYGPGAMEHGASTIHGGLFLVLGGLLTFLAGIAFIARNAFYHTHGLYLYNWGIDAWGWVLLGLGIVTFAVGASHLLGLPFSRPAGVVMAVLITIAGFMIVPFYTLWAIIIVALGLASLWGLAHGAQTRERERRVAEYERQRQMM
jgi:hypothetical protein